jgi:protocatechuate 3,4-dioxygenase beta subunit
MPEFPHLPLLSDTHATLLETLAVLQQRERLRRRGFLLGALGGAAALALLTPAACACVLIPAETGGPFPGNGSNGPNVLTQSGIVRADIRSSFGASGTAVAAGTPLTVKLRLVNTSSGCAPLAELAVYLWHCDATGGYSLYSSRVAGQNYLRGVQVSDDAGEVRFTTVFPGCYPSRWPHLHFEIYRSAATAVSGGNALRTSQLALPESACRTVYAQDALYPGSNRNFDRFGRYSDSVFGRDGGALQLAAASGDNSGWLSTLEVGLAV